MKETVAVVGASVRGIAQSAWRAGFRVLAFDLFGDLDLRQVAEQTHVIAPKNYPRGVLTHAAALRNVRWCYTGGIENHRAVVFRLAQRAPLWGNGGEVLRRVRDPNELSRVLASIGFPFPRTFPSASGADPNSRWLVKSRRGSGGGHVRDWDGKPIEREFVLQEFVPGRSYSAVFAADDDESILLGVCRQLLARDVESHPSAPFRYVGSVGPLGLAQDSDLRRMGQDLAERLRLRGLFGVDFQLVGEAIWVIEINPRYPASAEVLERATGESMFARHARCFDTAMAGQTARPNVPLGGVIAKRILFAPFDGRLDVDAPCYSLFPSPRYADIPAPGSILRKDSPILTLIESGSAEEDAKDRLDEAAHGFVARWFRPPR